MWSERHSSTALQPDSLKMDLKNCGHKDYRTLIITTKQQFSN